MINQAFLNTTSHNVAWFQKRYQANELELKAPFQRNPVWTKKQKAYLIDTILRGYPIPELYMQEFADADGNDVYIVVDGQQRVRACVEFVAGEFSLDAEDSPEFADMFFDDLSEDQKKAIYNYSLVVRVLPEMPEIQLRSIFQRLNRHVVSLNRQELRHATYWGEFITCIEKLADDERWTPISVFTPNDVRRMLDIEFISELVVGFLHGVQNKKESLDDWYESYEQEFGERREVEKVFSGTLSELHGLLPDISETRWRKKSDFYTLFLALAERSKQFPWARDARDKVSAAVRAFGADVDKYIRGKEDGAQFPKVVSKYSDAVEKAASDLNNRKTRRDALHAVIAKALGEPVPAEWA
jgi:Protein of unknown function DUF262